ncbi:MAG TPA: response regulator, partial [Chloroflexota bacterium]|nr:response regulator [Chloroflexota bacterium]
DARASLRTALVYLRQALGDAATLLLVTRETVGLSASAPFTLDVQTLAQAQRLARAVEVVPGLRGELERAIAAYRGPFLDGVSLPDAPPFEHWVAGQRAHWLGVVGELLGRLAVLHTHEGDLGAAVATLERWVALDPGEEGAWQRLIALHMEQDDYTAARRAWAACQAALAELDAEPSAETETLAARIRTLSPTRIAAATTLGSVGPEHLDMGTAPLVGRGRELARMRRVYEQVQLGQTRVILLEGAAGYGKTRLAGDLLAWAREQGADTLLGRAFETKSGLPYAAFLAALRPRLEHENAPDDLLGDVWLAELARLLPELRERYPDLSPASADETAGCGRLFEAVARLGQALAVRAPLVLCLDDVQWTHGTTRDLLRYAVRRWVESGVRALVLLAVRAEDVGADRALAQWLGSLERDAPTLRLGLEALTPEDVVHLVAVLAGAEAADQTGTRAEEAARFGQWLARETGGQPSAVVQTLRALLEQGVLALQPTEDGGWALDLARTSEVGTVATGRVRRGAQALGALDGETAPGTASAPAQVSSPQATAATLVSAPPSEPGDSRSRPLVARASRLGTPGCAARRPAPAASRARGDTVKILVVDDDQPILDALTLGLQLQWQDATVLVARDGEEGLRAFYEHSPDVVVLDVALPGQSGFAVLQEIRRTSDVPVLMLTARGEELDQVRGLELGADDYVVKPVRHLALLARIRAVLRRAELPPPQQALPDFVAGELAIKRWVRRRAAAPRAPARTEPIRH